MGRQLRVAGLDPSMRNFGMVKGDLDVSSSVFTPNAINLAETTTANKGKKTVRKNSQDLLRARKLYVEMTEFIADVDLIFVEIPVGSQSARAMASYGMCISLLGSISTPLIQVTPTEVKVITGLGKTATKDQMINWAASRYPDLPWFTRKLKGIEGLTKKNEHIADAIAAVHAGIETDQFKQATAILATF